jgi:hypothetical protein
VAGDIAVLSGLVLIIIYGSLYSFGNNSNNNDSKSAHNNSDNNSNSISLSDFPAFKSVSDGLETHTLLYYFGTTSFLFAIHAVILPILRGTLNDQNNDIFVISTLYTSITIANTFFGALGYILFSVEGLSCPASIFPASLQESKSTPLHPINRGPCPSILSNIHQGTMFLSVAKLFICIDLLFTIPLIVGASRQILDKSVTTCIDQWLSSSFLLIKRFCNGYGYDCGSDLNIGVNANTQYDPLTQVSTHDREADLETTTTPSSIHNTGRCNSNIITMNSSDSSNNSSNNSSNSHHSRHHHLSASSPLHSMYQEGGISPRDVITETDDNSMSSSSPFSGRPSSSTLQGLPESSASSSITPTSNSSKPELRDISIFISRLLFLLLIVILSQSMPHFGDVVSLVGGFVCALTGFLLPPALYLRMFPEECSWTHHPVKRLCLYLVFFFRIILNVCFCILGNDIK